MTSALRRLDAAALSMAAALLLVILSAGAGNAGEIRQIELVDGSVIAGEIISAVEGVYTVRTVSLGTIRVEEAKIRAIRATAPPVEAPGASPTQVQSLLFRMLGDQQVMSMITSLRNDPEFQKILEDPEVMAAVTSGNVAALSQNPLFMKLLEKKTVRDIMDKMAP